MQLTIAMTIARMVAKRRPAIAWVSVSGVTALHALKRANRPMIVVRAAAPRSVEARIQYSSWESDKRSSPRR